FQLDGMYDFKADIAILLNITPDHLDRYAYQMENYVRSKFRITNNLDENCWFIYNADDAVITEYIQHIKTAAQTASFSLQHEVKQGGYLDKQQITINIKDQFTMSIHDLALKGKHNAANSLASGITARILEIRKDVL